MEQNGSFLISRKTSTIAQTLIRISIPLHHRAITALIFVVFCVMVAASVPITTI